MSHGHELDRDKTAADDNPPPRPILEIVAATYGNPGYKRAVSLSSVNLNQRTTDAGIITQFPNGLEISNGQGRLHIEAPPPGGQVNSNGEVLDAKNKVVANVSPDKAIHVHTKNGDYVETVDGHITFTPITDTKDLTTLHHSGPVRPDQFEDYGISTDGHVTRFPNGTEYNHTTGKVNGPDTDSTGHALFTLDKNGIHVHTSDGMLSQSRSGAVQFQPTPAPKPHKQDKPKKEECAQGDPLCGTLP